MSISLQHQRRSIRLPGYDYSQAGEYFITICTHEHEYLFGEIVKDEMQLNAFGRIVEDEWQKSAEIRMEIELGAYVIMPNHFHAIVHILDSDDPKYKDTAGIPNDKNKSNSPVRAYGHTPVQQQLRSPSKTLGSLVRGFKGSVTIKINELRCTPGLPVWQRNYYEHIIQSEKEYLTIEAYIENNPANWGKDTLWPKNR